MATYVSGTDTLTIDGTVGTPDTPATIVAAVANTAKAYFADTTSQTVVLKVATMLNGTGVLSLPADSVLILDNCYWNKNGATGKIILNERSEIRIYGASTWSDSTLGALTGFEYISYRDNSGVNPRITHSGVRRYDYISSKSSPINTPKFTITGLDVVSRGTISVDGISASLKFYASADSSISNLRIFSLANVPCELQFLRGTQTNTYVRQTTVSLSASAGETLLLDYPTFDFGGTSSPMTFRFNALSTINIQDPAFPNGAWNGAYAYQGSGSNVRVNVSFSDTETFLSGASPIVMRAEFKRNDGVLITATGDGSGVVARTVLLTSVRPVTGVVATYTWDCKARSYGYKVAGSESLYTAKAFSSVRVGTNQTTPVPFLSINEASASALTGISMSPSGATSGTITVSEAHTLAEVWCYYRQFISQFANFSSDDTWSFDGTTLNAGAWDVVVAVGGSLSGSALTTTGTVTILGTTTLASYTGSGGTFVIIGFINAQVSGTGTTWSWLYNDTDSADVWDKEETSSSYSQYIQYTADKSMRLRMTFVDGPDANTEFEAFGTLTANGLTFDIRGGVDDTVYIANGIDGFGVTEITADGANLECDVTDSDNSLAIQRVYAWYKAYLTTSDGIRNFWGAITAKDTVNYTINKSAIALKFDNKKTDLLKILGGSIINDDGTTDLVSATTTGPIYFHSGDAPSVQVWSNVLEPGFTADRILRIIAAAVAGKTTDTPTSFVARNLADTQNQINGVVDPSTGRTSATYGS